MKPPKNNSLFKLKALIAVSIFIFSVGAIWTFVVGQVAEKRETNSIITRVRTAAAVLHPYGSLSLIQNLTGQPENVYSPDYVLVKEILSNMRNASTDVRFAYLMAESNIPNKLLFLADSEPADSPDISLPGDIYEDTTQEELVGFKDGIPFIEGPYADQWGTWISGFAPIIETGTDKVVALLGMDVDASLWKTNVNHARIVPIIVTFSVFLFLLFFYLFERGIDKIRAELIYITSHQLSTPLTAIKWHTEALLDEDFGVLNAKQSEYLKQISTSTDRLISLVANLLNAARIERGEEFEVQKEEVHIPDIIDLILSDLVELMKNKNVSVKKTPSFSSAQEIKFYADKVKIYEVFQNLISNAVKYSKSGGEVVLGFEEKLGLQVFSIKDAGFGIPKADQPKVFNKFFRGSNVSSPELKGNGLGLYLVRMIIKKHHGKIWFESEENKGSTFFVYLPQEK